MLGSENNLPQQYLLEMEGERMAATEALRQIGKQKPEIIMVKIAGLQQELRTIKTMLGKQKRYLGMKNTGLPFDTGNTNIQNAVTKAKLPEIEQGKEGITDAV